MKKPIIILTIMIGLGLGCDRVSYCKNWFFTFDFSSAPNPLNSGGDGDDWLDIAGDGIGFENNSETHWAAQYGQTVGGRSGVVKINRVPQSVMRFPILYTGSPTAHSGQDWHKKLGRINSWPDDYDTYSTWRFQTDLYISGVQSEATHWKIISIGMGVFSGTANINIASGLPIVADQWVTLDSGTQAMDPTTWFYPNGEGDFFRFLINLDASNGDEPSILDPNDGTAFFALDNFTISFK